MLTGNLRCISKELTGSINAATANPEAQKPLRTLQTEGKGQASAVDIDGPVDAGSCEGTDTRQDHKSRAPSLHGTMNRGRWDSRCWFLGKGTTHDSSTNTADPSPWPRHCRDVQQAGRDDVLQQPAKGEEQQQGRQSQTQRRQPNASTIPGACHNQEAATHSHDRSCEHQDLPQVHRSRWLQSPSPGHPIPLLGLQQLPWPPLPAPQSAAAPVGATDQKKLFPSSAREVQSFNRACASSTAAFPGGRVDRIQAIFPPGLGNQKMARNQTRLCNPRLLRPPLVMRLTIGPEIGTAPAGVTQLMLAGRNTLQRPAPPHTAGSIPAHRLGNAVACHHTLSSQWHQQ